ncbi:MAG: ABC transporter ATP-binding protein [Ahniella sp.]|nr:ABC transporter ATP-binding protein [Ahniella sp.]
MIKLQNIQRQYTTRAGSMPVLRDIQLDVPKGAFVSIVGPSGSGKSTLLQVLGLLDNAWTGEYWFEGQALHALNGKQRQAFSREAVAFVFQQYHLLDDLTVAENIELPLTYRSVPAREVKARVEAMLERFDLGARRHDYPNQLSGGQQQVVAVARALIAAPRLLLADEPTGALHSDQGRLIMDLLADLNRAGTTIIQVTHNPEFAARGQQVLRMQDGKLVGA